MTYEELLDVQMKREVDQYHMRREQVMSRFASDTASGEFLRTPAGKRLMKEWMADFIESMGRALNPVGVGRHGAVIPVIKKLPPELLVYLTMHGIMSNINSETATYQKIANHIGMTVDYELQFAIFEEANPALYDTVVNRLNDDGVKNVTRRAKVLQNAMLKAHVVSGIGAWMGPKMRTKIGIFLIDVFMDCGGDEYVEFKVVSTGPRAQDARRVMAPTADFLEWVERYERNAAYKIAERLSGNYYVVPPREWSGLYDGGPHHPLCRAWNRPCVHNPRYTILDDDPYYTADAVAGRVSTLNRLQRVAWEVHPAVARAVVQIVGLPVAAKFKQLVSPDVPDKPTCSVDRRKKDGELTDEEEAELLEYKIMARKYHDAMVQRIVVARKQQAYLQFIQEAGQYDAIYFEWFMDFRGRFYPVGFGVTPQADDLSRGLLRLHRATRLGSADAVREFQLHGAGRYGLDKATPEQRVQWVDEHEALICAIAADPIGRIDDWATCDKPFQFLAWACEYAEFVAGGKSLDFEAHGVGALDGTCNGLQHFSAMLRDEVGGANVNLIDSEIPADIYTRGAEKAIAKIRVIAATGNELARQWLDYGIARKLAKKPIMTTPYGVTKQGVREYITEYLLEHPNPEWPTRVSRRLASMFLRDVLWDAIGEVVVAARRAQRWLQANSKKMTKDGICVHVCPDGFPVVQAYFKPQTTMIRSRHFGNVRVADPSKPAHPDSMKARNGISPNFVHSLDSNHLSDTVTLAAAEGFEDFWMVHDDYGVPYAQVTRLRYLIRKAFVDMYTKHDPLQDFAGQYGLTCDLERGKLDINGIYQSKYFFD